MTTFTYRDLLIEIVPGNYKKKSVYYIYIAGKALTFVSNPDTAKRIAVNFIDVSFDSFVSKNRQGTTRNVLNVTSNYYLKAKSFKGV